MTKPDPFASLSRNERAALEEICGRSVLLSGDVQRIAFLHNASFNRVRSLLPAYRANRDAAVAAIVAASPAFDDPGKTIRNPAADPAGPVPEYAKSEIDPTPPPTPKPSRWQRSRK